MVFDGFDDLLPWFVLALGAALVVGTGLALVRPLPEPDDDEPDAPELVRPPLGRSVVMIAIGLLATVWGIASLVSR